jgi:hypothetical protein
MEGFMSRGGRDAIPVRAYELELERDGARHFPGAFDRQALVALEAVLAPLPPERAGARLGGLSEILPLVGPADAIARARLGPDARAVRALLLDKNRDRNWTLGWHQDRVIAVRERRPAPGYDSWTVKAGLDHVEPPFAILERMLTLRIHFDDVGPDNALLLVAPGSHRIGPVPEDEIEPAVARLGVTACIARAGDVWLYGAPILHASERARTPSRRRVLQLSYSADRLGHGLEWLGVQAADYPPSRA